MPYRLIASTETDPEAPITSALMKALDGNVAATAAGEAGAPKIKQLNVISAAATGTQTFTGLGDFSGLEFDIMGNNSSAVAVNLTIEYSTDGGSTWAGTTTIVSISGPSHFFGSGHFNFANGLVELVAKSLDGSSSFFRGTQTVPGASLSIDAVRFLFGFQQQQCIIRPNGGTV